MNQNIFFEILLHLENKDYLNLCLTCKLFYEYFKQEPLWYYKVNMECHEFYLKYKKDYYTCYKTFFILTNLKQKVNYKGNIEDLLKTYKLSMFSQNNTYEIPKEIYNLSHLKYIFINSPSY